MTEGLYIQAFAASLSVVLLLCNIYGGKQNKKSLLIHIMLSANLLRSLLYMCTILLEGNAELALLNKIITALTSVGYVSIGVFTIYLKYNMKKPSSAPKVMVNAAVGLSGLQIVLYIASIFAPVYFTIRNGRYVNGEFFWVEPLLLIGTMVINAAIVIKCREQFIKRSFRAMLTCTVLPIISAAFMLVTPHEPDIAVIGLTLTLVVIYIINHLLTEKLQAEQQEMKINTRVELLISQVKPHFIFNALATITYLYETGKPEAPRIMQAFCKYLRNALDFDHQGTLSTFGEDLDHLESYFTIEKMRFPNIDIEYSFDVLDFWLPFYTMQPLVENAIKHGIRPTGTGGVVKLSTKETDRNIVLTIEDNGIGFVPDHLPDDGKTHLGIIHTRTRIEQLCGGTLDVQSELGVGTTITIKLPKNKKLRRTADESYLR